MLPFALIKLTRIIKVIVIVKNKINSEVDKVNTEVKCLRSARDWKGER